MKRKLSMIEKATIQVDMLNWLSPRVVFVCRRTSSDTAVVAAACISLKKKMNERKKRKKKKFIKMKVNIKYYGC